MILALVAIFDPAGPPLEGMITVILSRRAMTTGCKRALGRHFSKNFRLSGSTTPRETEEPSPGTQALAMIYTGNLNKGKDVF